MLRTARFALLVHHDDAERELAHETSAGNELATTRTRGRTVAGMKRNLTTVV
jgi:hypothetical protein